MQIWMSNSIERALGGPLSPRRGPLGPGKKLYAGVRAGGRTPVGSDAVDERGGMIWGERDFVAAVANEGGFGVVGQGL